jgi:hypothetical protein
MPRRTKRRTNRKLKKGGSLANLGPYASKKPKMDQRGRHEMVKRNRTMVESSEGVRGCGFTSWNKSRKKKSCVSDKWKQRGCYWLDPANACYDVNEQINWKQLEAKGLPKSVVKKAKKVTKQAKRDYKKLKGRSDYLTSESLKSSSRSSSKRSSRSSRRSSKRSSRR